MPTPVIRGGARWASYIRAFTKPSWDAEWVEQPYLKAQSASRLMPPQIGEADLLYHFGEVQQTGTREQATYLPLSLVGHFLKITSQKGDEEPQNLDWVGIIEEDTQAVKSNVSLRGVQSIKAYTLERLLYREIIRKAWCKNAPTLAEFEIEWAPSFNLRHKRDRGERALDPVTKELLGNADDEQTVFSYQSLWNGRKAIKYLLDRYAPKPIPWALTGQDLALEQFKDIWQQEGLSIGAIIDSIVNHKKGFVWYVDTDGEDFADVRVSTIFGNDFTVGATTIPANDRQTFYEIPISIPERHIFGSPALRYSNRDKYDKIIVQGRQIKVLGNWSYKDLTLVEGWLPAVETAYKDINTGDPQLNDTLRARDHFKRVWTTFVVPRQGVQLWDGKLGNGLNAGFANALPVSDIVGSISFPSPADVGFYMTGRQFEAAIPLLHDIDYSKAVGDAGFDNRSPLSDPDYRRPMVLFENPFNAKYLVAELMHIGAQYFHPASVHVLEKELGIFVHCTPNHHLAKASPSEEIPVARRGTFVVDPLRTMHSNMIDYKTIIATLFLETDRRPYIEIPGANPGPNNQKLIVTVKGCECWYAMGTTIVDVSTTGDLMRIHASHAIPNALRYDKSLLETVAAIVREWWAVERQAITLPVKDVGYGASITPELGVYITEIKGLIVSKPVNATVTGVRFDYKSGTSSFETNFPTLDEILSLAELDLEMQSFEHHFDFMRR